MSYTLSTFLFTAVGAAATSSLFRPRTPVGYSLTAETRPCGG
jgi:hypothetical protein